MNRALWNRAWHDVRVLLASCCVLLFLFNWLFVWLTSKIDLAAFDFFLQMLPKEWQKVSPVPMSEIASPAGRIVLGYIDPVTIATYAVWCIGRGSDAVSGQLGRGTLEMVVAQPVRRSAVLLTPALVTTLGTALLTLATWLGTCTGIATVTLPNDDRIAAAIFLPPVLNLFAFGFFLAGITTLLSSCDRFRGRTIGIVSGFYIVSLIFKVVARMAPGWEWLMYLSFFGAFEPQAFVAEPGEAWRLALEYNSVLIGLGLAAYAAATVIFTKRDLPAPI
jgi:ABC-2 type transport system permease protein